MQKTRIMKHLFTKQIIEELESKKFRLNDGGDIHIKDKIGKKPLHNAVCSMNKKKYNSVKLLIEMGVNINEITNKGETLIKIALWEA